MRLSDGDDEMAQLNHGIAAGLDPRPAVDPVAPGGVAVTRPSSWWNRRRCRSCGHTFRRGDRVLVDQHDLDQRKWTVAHLVPGLGCAESGDTDTGRAAADQAEVAELAAGLLAAWPADPPVPVVRLPAGDWRIPTGPDDLREDNVCLRCGHTFRAGEHVVVCPCRAVSDTGSGAAACGRAVHRDPAIGLPCWESLWPTGKIKVCPVTQVVLDRG